LFIFISVIFFVGCGEKKEVTKDMLIGTWHCEYIDSKLKFKSGHEISPMDLENFDVTYVKKDNQFYEIKKYKNKEEEKIYKFGNSIKETVPMSDGSIQKADFQFKYISNDEFNEITEVQKSMPNNDNLEFQLNMMLNCKRAK